MNDTQNGTSLPMARNAGELAVVTREQQELQAGIITAKKWPRDEVEAIKKMRRSFSYVSMAEAAYYSLTRGNTEISGESVRAAEEIARCWGNLDFGFLVLEHTEEEFTLKGYAVDMESNTRAQFFGKYKNLIQRKDKKNVTQWIKPDELQFRELANNYGARLYRNAILKLIPFYVKDEIEAICEDTLRKASKLTPGDNKRAGLIANMVKNFASYGVTQAALEAKAGNKLAECDDETLQNLWEIGRGIAKKETTVEAHFPGLQKAQPQKAASAEPKTEPKETPPYSESIRMLLEESAKVKVTQAMLEKRCGGKPAASFTDDDVLSMLNILELAANGQVQLDREFPELGA
jgi:hypothetical protein